MGFEVNGGPRIPPEQRLNVFALVIYVPDPLGRFLDDLRLQLTPDCNPHAHVSVLPPRPIAEDWLKARERVRSLTEAWTPFEITLGEISVFPITNVVYLELNTGAPEMHRLHAAMNSGLLEFDEPFTYHPHLTLAQEIAAPEVDRVVRRAREIWAGFEGPRSFRAERATFVQNTLGSCWVDLAEYLLGQ